MTLTMDDVLVEPVPKAVAAALAELGAHLDGAGVAYALRDQEVWGQRGDAYRCPIANYLLRRCSGIITLAVAAQMVTVIFLDLRGAMTYRVLPTPPAVEQFIRHFDAGGFPDIYP